MTIRASTGLRNRLLDTGALKSIFNLGFLNLYSGPVPGSADDAIVGGTHQMLCALSNNNTATGITLASSASGGAITKNLSETWSHAAAYSGTATFYRLVSSSDTAASSTTEARLQGTVGTSGADLNLATVTLTATTVYAVDTFSISLPTY